MKAQGECLVVLVIKMKMKVIKHTSSSILMITWCSWVWVLSILLVKICLWESCLMRNLCLFGVKMNASFANLSPIICAGQDQMVKCLLCQKQMGRVSWYPGLSTGSMNLAGNWPKNNFQEYCDKKSAITKMGKLKKITWFIHLLFVNWNMAPWASSIL